MSMEDAKKFYERVATDEAVRKEVKASWDQVEAIAKKHNLHFTHAEYFDFVHGHTGMTKVGRSDEHDDTDTCICLIPSEPPRF